MAKRKAPPTREQHQEWGADLHRLRHELQRLGIDLPYPKAHRTQQQLTRAVQAIDRLRALLDGQFAIEAGDDFSTKIYYPGAAP
jgi:hypothetical protein